MTAEIVKLPIPRKYRAWCEDCQDGYQGGKPTCIKWATKHNTERHPTPTKDDNE